MHLTLEADMRALTVLALLLIVLVSDAVTQEQPLQPGQRVRVTAPYLGINKQVARFDALDGGVLAVTADSTMRCPLLDVTRLDVYRGRQGHPWLGAGIGSAVGAVTGVVIGVQLCNNDWLCPDRYMGWAVLAGLGIGGATGALLGAGIGTLIKTDRWQEVPLEQLRVNVLPLRDGRLALGLSVAF
jgi:hypothetical protein